MDRSPHVAAFNRTERRKLAAHVSLFNAYLDAYVDALPTTYPDASALLFDTHSTVSKMLDAPADYGFKNNDGWCGAYEQLVMDPDANDEEECDWPLREYAWYDSYHLSWRAQEELGKAVGEVSISCVLEWRALPGSRHLLHLDTNSLPFLACRLFPSRPKPSASASAGTRSRPAGLAATSCAGICRLLPLPRPPPALASHSLPRLYIPLASMACLK